MSCRNIDIKDEFIKELKEELKLRQAELEGSRYLIKRIGATLRKAWEEHKEGEVYPGLNDEDIGWAFDLLVTQKALELACERLYDFYEHDCRSLCPIKEDACKFPYRTIGDCWKSIKDWMLTQAKEVTNETQTSSRL